MNSCPKVGISAMVAHVDNFQSKRGAKRTRVVLTAMLMTPEGAHSVRIRDLSPFGAQICGSQDIPSECDAILKRGTLFAAARIIWSENKIAGLRFFRTLAPQELDEKLCPALLEVGS